MSEPIKNRVDFTLLYDVENGNPNGDPDAGNAPRVDPVSQHGIVTDVCLKRKIRNYVAAAKEDEPGYGIYISSATTLNANDRKAYDYLGLPLPSDERAKKNKAKNSLKKDHPEADEKIKEFMCKNFYDIRTFGAVMTTMVKDKLNCGQITGPVQIGFSKSLDPVIPQEITITRVAITREEDAKDKATEFGKKNIIPYALYEVHGYISANLARKVTGFSEEDLELFWEALMNMFEIDHSAARGNMAVRSLITFEHSSELGNCPAHKLFEAVKVTKKEGVVTPTSFADYTIAVDYSAIPDSVKVDVKV